VKLTGQTLILLDLDGTLLDTERLIDDILRVVQPDSPAQAAEIAAGIRDYRARFGSSATLPMISLLGDTFAQVKQQIRQADYVYPDATQFIQRLTKRGVKPVILTYGDRAFQQFKIKGTLLEHLPLEISRDSTKVNYIKSSLLRADGYRYADRNYSSLALFDDKPASFSGFDSLAGATGYLLSRQSQSGPNLKNVRLIKSLTEAVF
jgi:hypothetical protein